MRHVHGLRPNIVALVTAADLHSRSPDVSHNDSFIGKRGAGHESFTTDDNQPSKFHVWSGYTLATATMGRTLTGQNRAGLVTLLGQ